MIRSIFAWFGGVTTPWLWIAAGIITAVLLATVAGGYIYVNNLQNNLIEARVALSAEKTKVDILTKTVTRLKEQAEIDRKNREELIADNAADNEAWLLLINQANDLDACPEPTEGKTDDPPAPVATDIDRLNDELNRMLNDATARGSVD